MIPRKKHTKILQCNVVQLKFSNFYVIMTRNFTVHPYWIGYTTVSSRTMVNQCSLFRIVPVDLKIIITQSWLYISYTAMGIPWPKISSKENFVRWFQAWVECCKVRPKYLELRQCNFVTRCLNKTYQCSIVYQPRTMSKNEEFLFVRKKFCFY